ncbi:response regulator transcription factor [Pseudomonas sp. MYb185]|uniref:response regulator n=1 Tax=Pseudomonas sp. MYb185 TaxID=1848729 RepID=UPI000CFBC84E|nr:response regulator transcription factor [Pseudomonas sp. MYb185]PRB84496.1 DNA-binding response regulator [Pseudomonas sp. MYb185]
MSTTSQPQQDALLPTPVLVVEDEPLMQQRLRMLLQQLGYCDDALAFSSNLAQARVHMQEQPIALALVDLGLPDGSGIELISELRSADPGLYIVVISAWSTEDLILAALRAGATGYILKERDDLEISFSIRNVLRGGVSIDPFIARRILALLPGSPPLQDSTHADGSDDAAVSLSRRETEILQLVGQGFTNREIAESLFISRYTVETHIKNTYKKLAVSSRTRAVNEARLLGLLP